MTEDATNEVATALSISFAIKMVPSRASRRTRIGWCSTRSIGRPSVRIVARHPWRDGRRREEHIVQVPLSKGRKLDARTERRLLSRVHAYLVRVGYVEGEIHPIQEELRDRLVGRGICEPSRPSWLAERTETEVRRMVDRVKAKLRDE